MSLDKGFSANSVDHDDLPHFGISSESTMPKYWFSGFQLDWLQSLKHFFINVSYHILVANLTLMALF